MRHAADANEFLEVLREKLRTVVGDDARPGIGKLLQSALKNNFDLLLFHRLPDLPVHDVAARPIQHTAQVIKCAGNVDVSYINVSGTFYYLCSVLDGTSRYIVHWEIRESMKEQEVEIILQRALEKFPDARPRIISDNGPQFLAKDFKEFIRICGMTHVRTSPYYPQSNGKIERWHKSIKAECIRPGVPLSLEDAQRVVTFWIDHYNTVRLHSAIGYLAPIDKLEGRATQIFAQRDRKLEEARLKRQQRRQQCQPPTISGMQGLATVN